MCIRDRTCTVTVFESSALDVDVGDGIGGTGFTGFTGFTELYKFQNESMLNVGLSHITRVITTADERSTGDFAEAHYLCLFAQQIEFLGWNVANNG